MQHAQIEIQLHETHTTFSPPSPPFSCAVPRRCRHGGGLNILWLPLCQPAGPQPHVTSAQQLQHLQRQQQLWRRLRQRRPQLSSIPFIGGGHALIFAAFVHALPELPPAPPSLPAPQLRHAAARRLQLDVGGEQRRQNAGHHHSTTGGGCLGQLAASGQAHIDVHADAGLGADVAAAGCHVG